jgi:hypothetical protein
MPHTPLQPRYAIHIEENDATGQVGFLLSELPKFEDPIVDFGSGEMIAHDIIEHTNGLNAIGTLHDELMALGAMFAVRVETGYLAEEKWAGMYYELFEHYKANPCQIPIPGCSSTQAKKFPHVTLDIYYAVRALDSDYGLVKNDTDKVLFLSFLSNAKMLGAAGYKALLSRFGESQSPKESVLALFQNIESTIRSNAYYVDEINLFATFSLSLPGNIASANMDPSVLRLMNN